MDPKTLAQTLTVQSQESLIGHLGIEILEANPELVRGKMPVDQRTIQPFGLLHGGASVALAETLGSIAASLNIDMTRQAAVGLEINANHLRSVRQGYVYGAAQPIHRGRTTQVWEIKITDETDRPVAISRLTMMILDKPDT